MDPPSSVSALPTDQMVAFLQTPGNCRPDCIKAWADKDQQLRLVELIRYIDPILLRTATANSDATSISQILHCHDKVNLARRPGEAPFIVEDQLLEIHGCLLPRGVYDDDFCRAILAINRNRIPNLLEVCDSLRLSRESEARRLESGCDTVAERYDGVVMQGQNEESAVGPEMGEDNSLQKHVERLMAQTNVLREENHALREHKIRIEEAHLDEQRRQMSRNGKRDRERDQERDRERDRQRDRERDRVHNRVRKRKRQAQKKRRKASEAARRSEERRIEAMDYEMQTKQGLEQIPETQSPSPVPLSTRGSRQHSKLPSPNSLSPSEAQASRESSSARESQHSPTSDPMPSSKTSVDTRSPVVDGLEDTGSRKRAHEQHDSASNTGPRTEQLRLSNPGCAVTFVDSAFDPFPVKSSEASAPGSSAANPMVIPPDTPRKPGRRFKFPGGRPLSSHSSSVSKGKSQFATRLTEPHFGLIQEQTCEQPFQMLLAVILLNKTQGRRAIPVFYDILAHFPGPADLAEQEPHTIEETLVNLGLQKKRSQSIVRFAKEWLAHPPQHDRRHRTLNYPFMGDGTRILPNEVVQDEDFDDRPGALEIGHFHGLGHYAYDCWRIFCRDVLRGRSDHWLGLKETNDKFEPEWQRVIPKDKELRALLRWCWLKYRQTAWDPDTGVLQQASEELLHRANRYGDLGDFRNDSAELSEGRWLPRFGMVDSSQIMPTMEARFERRNTPAPLMPYSISTGGSPSSPGSPS